MSKDILGQSNFTLMIKGANYVYIHVHVKQIDYSHVHVHVDHKDFGNFNEG